MSFIMPADLKKKWVDALRSGEYLQVDSFLCRERADGDLGYCCLGVLQMVADGKVEEPKEVLRARSLQLPTVGWYRDHGIQNDDTVALKDSEEYSLGVWATPYQMGFNNPNMDRQHTPIKYYLSELNDDYHFSFEQIADIIEDKVETYWSPVKEKK